MVDQPASVRPRQRFGDIGMDPSLIAAGGAALALLVLVMFGGERPQAPPLASQAAAATTVAPASTRGVAAGTVITDCPECPAVVIVPVGFFTVGAPESDLDARAHEKPMRGGSVRRPFAVGRTEVTVREYSAFVAATGRAAPACPGLVTDAAMPQNCLSAQDGDAYVQWLAARSGKSFRLLSHDEWEYAAKAHGGGAASSSKPLVAADLAPANAFALHGMRGNLAELVSDCWESDDAIANGVCVKRTAKDGSWLDAPAQSRPSAKRAVRHDLRSERVGLRVARDLDLLERGD